MKFQTRLNNTINVLLSDSTNKIFHDTTKLIFLNDNNRLRKR